MKLYFKMENIKITNCFEKLQQCKKDLKVLRGLAIVAILNRVVK